MIARNGFEDTLELLIKNGADVNLKNVIFSYFKGRESVRMILFERLRRERSIFSLKKLSLSSLSLSLSPSHFLSTSSQWSDRICLDINIYPTCVVAGGLISYDFEKAFPIFPNLLHCYLRMYG